jgi:AcrR family transcriptional regulator
VDLVNEFGYADVTIEAIAARAGAGKQTIYRWWPSKADVLLEAGVELAELHDPEPDHGSYEADLRAFLEASYRLANRDDLSGILRALMAEAQLDSEFAIRFRDEFLRQRAEALLVITERARRRGDLPENPDAATVADVVFGTIWYRILATQRPFDERLLDDLLVLLAGARPHRPRPLTLRASAESLKRPLPWRDSAHGPAGEAGSAT